MEHKISNELPPLPSENMPPNAPPGPEYQAHELVAERQGAQAVESGSSQQPSLPTQQVPQADPPQQVPPLSQQPTDQGTIDPQSPIIADDSDLIEKEWVLKAKEIVMRTRHDPYQQNKEVERVKADYMKKRYNKDIRVTED
jgi:hypothetical protein